MQVHADHRQRGRDHEVVEGGHEEREAGDEHGPRAEMAIVRVGLRGTRRLDVDRIG